MQIHETVKDGDLQARVGFSVHNDDTRSRARLLLDWQNPFPDIGWRDGRAAVRWKSPATPCPLGSLLPPLAPRNDGDDLKQLFDSGLILIHKLSGPHLVVFDCGALLHARILFTQWRGIVGDKAV